MENKKAWDLGEFGLIDRIRKQFPKIDLTDDCAVVHPQEGDVLVTVDCAVRGVHFPLSSEFMSDGGFRAFAGAVSDINASAGSPTGALLALEIPQDLTLPEFEDFIAGIKKYSKISSVPIIGGNITRGSNFSATITVIGFSEKPIGRSGAKPDDIIILSGSVGGSEAGRLLLEGEIDIDSLDAEAIGSLKSRFLRPNPPLGLGIALAELGATSMIDISDGLLADISHIAEASSVACHIELERLPLFRGVSEIAKAKKIRPELLAASSGEEFELIATVPQNAIPKIKAQKLPITVIGNVKKGHGVKVFLEQTTIDPTSKGWVHF